MSDIYSSQDEILLQNGLAAADAESHFKAKLESLKPLCSDVVPGFHHWFESNGSKQFKDCLILQHDKFLELNADSIPMP